MPPATLALFVAHVSRPPRHPHRHPTLHGPPTPPELISDPRCCSPLCFPPAAVRIPRDVSWGRHFYEIYYEPRTLTTLEQTLLLTMNSTADRWSASPDAERNVASLSPFTVPANAPRTTFTFELGGNVRKLFAGVQIAASASSSTVALRVPSSASLSRIADAETTTTTGSYDALDVSDAPDRQAAARVDASGGGEASSSDDAYQRGARIRAQLAVPFPVVQDADVAIYSRYAFSSGVCLGRATG